MCHHFCSQEFRLQTSTSQELKFLLGVLSSDKGLQCCLWLLFLLSPDGGARDSECGRLCVQHVSVHAAALSRLHAGSHVRRRPAHRQGRKRKLLHWPWWPAFSVRVCLCAWVCVSMWYSKAATTGVEKWSQCRVHRVATWGWLQNGVNPHIYQRFIYGIVPAPLEVVPHFPLSLC